MRELGRLFYHTIGREHNTQIMEPLATRTNVVNFSPFFVFVDEQTRNFFLGSVAHCKFLSLFSIVDEQMRNFSLGLAAQLPPTRAAK
jgi:hypothetical protein